MVPVGLWRNFQVTWTSFPSPQWQTRYAPSSLHSSSYRQHSSEQFHFHDGGTQDPSPHHVYQKNDPDKQHSLHYIQYANQAFQGPMDYPNMAPQPLQTASKTKGIKVPNEKGWLHKRTQRHNYVRKKKETSHLHPLTFHKAKSAGFCFLESTVTRSPALLSSNFRPDKRPYAGNLSTEKYTSPSTLYAKPLSRICLGKKPPKNKLPWLLVKIVHFFNRKLKY